MLDVLCQARALRNVPSCQPFSLSKGKGQSGRKAKRRGDEKGHHTKCLHTLTQSRRHYFLPFRFEESRNRTWPRNGRPLSRLYPWSGFPRGKAKRKLNKVDRTRAICRPFGHQDSLITVEVFSSSSFSFFSGVFSRWRLFFGFLSFQSFGSS